MENFCYILIGENEMIWKHREMCVCGFLINKIKATEMFPARQLLLCQRTSFSKCWHTKRSAFLKRKRQNKTSSHVKRFSQREEIVQKHISRFLNLRSSKWQLERIITCIINYVIYKDFFCIKLLISMYFTSLMRWRNKCHFLQRKSSLSSS